MKRVVLTALAVTLLCGTSALAQGGAVASRRAQLEAEGRSRSEPRPQPDQTQARVVTPRVETPREETPRSQPQRGDRGVGSEGRGGRGESRGEGRGQRTLAGAVAQAQQPAQAAQRPQGERSQSGQWQGQRGPGGQQWQGQRPSVQQGQVQGRDGRSDQGQRRPDSQSDRGPSGGPGAGNRYDDRRGGYDNRGAGWNNDRGPQGRPHVIRPEDRRDRDRNRPRYDQRRYPHYVTPQQRFRWHGPSYYPPIGFYSYRWQFGQTLPWNWYTPNYYLEDWWSYGLPMPPVGYEWIRAGDDAILVDVFTGRIYQVVYRLFW